MEIILNIIIALCGLVAIGIMWAAAAAVFFGLV